jgi:hypothetical protein
MPRMDGSPTAAERKDAERREANRRYILDGRILSHLEDWILSSVRSELADDPAVVAAIDAELARRRS